MLLRFVRVYEYVLSEILDGGVVDYLLFSYIHRMRPRFIVFARFIITSLFIRSPWIHEFIELSILLDMYESQ